MGRQAASRGVVELGGVVVNLSDDPGRWSLGRDEVGGRPLHLLGLVPSSFVASLVIEPSDR